MKGVDNIRALVLRTIFAVLRPLIHMLIRQGISHSEFAELSRRVYVDVAERDFAIASRKQTTSRIAVLTGLSRKEVVRLRNSTDEDPVEEKGPVNRAIRVINGWLNDPEFIDDEARPRSLPYGGEQASFTQLVKRYSGDITAGAILDELLRVGAIKEEKGVISLSAQAYIPSQGEGEKYEVVRICATDMLNTLNHNLSDQTGDLRFQRQLTYHNLTPETYEKFRELSADKSQQLINELRTWLETAKRKQKAPGNIRTGIGMYVFKDE